MVALIGQLAGALEIPRRLSEGHVCRAMRSEGFGLLVAEQKSTIIGVLSHSVRPSLSHGEDCCLIEEPVIDAPHPGQGIGTALVDALLGADGGPGVGRGLREHDARQRAGDSVLPFARVCGRGWAPGAPPPGLMVGPFLHGLCTQAGDPFGRLD